VNVGRKLLLSKPRTRATRRQIAVCGLALFTILAFLTAPLVADEDSQKFARVATLIQTGKLDQAEELLWEVLTQHPENAEALNLLGSVRLQQKRFVESETLLRRATSLAPALLPAYINLARVFRAQAETDKEVAILLDALRLAPSDAEVNSSLAAAYLQENDYPRALEALQRIPIQHRPDSALPLLAASYLGLGRVTEARALAAAVASRAAKNPALRVEYAEVLLDFDLTNDALALLEIAQKQQAPTSRLYFALGRARERKGDILMAQRDFRRAVDLDSTSMDALQALARVLVAQGQWEKSLEVLSRARVAAPKSPDVLRKFAAASLHAGHTADAVDAAQQLVNLRPDEPEALYLLGVAQLQAGDTEEARSTIQEYIKLRSRDPLAFLALGMAAAGLRDFPAARENFEQSIKLDPNQVEAYYQLALISRDQGDNQNAISQLMKAVAVDPKHAQAHALLGTLYLQQRQYDKAQEHLTRAAELAPSFPDTHYQLGLLYARLNQREHAQREMEQFHKLKEKENPGPVQPGSKPAHSSPPYPPS
jgi:tetratricopeptide (TPR) repeat protein